MGSLNCIDCSLNATFLKRYKKDDLQEEKANREHIENIFWNIVLNAVGVMKRYCLHFFFIFSLNIFTSIHLAAFQFVKSALLCEENVLISIMSEKLVYTIQRVGLLCALIHAVN